MKRNLKLFFISSNLRFKAWMQMRRVYLPFFAIISLGGILCVPGAILQSRIKALHKTKALAYDVVMLAKKRDIDRKKQNEAMKSIASAHANYLEEQIESFIPLHIEIEGLEALLAHENLRRNSQWKSRLDFLKNQNRVVFETIKTRKTKVIEEVQLKSKCPLETSLSDIDLLLAKLEGVKVGPYVAPSGKPDLLINAFQLVAIKDGVYELQFECMKREMIR